MKNTKELHSILGVLYFLNRLGNNDKDIENVLNYAFDHIFEQNTYNLMIACIGHTKETAMDEIMNILKEDTKYHEYIERRKNR